MQRLNPQMSDDAAHVMRIAKATHGGTWVEFFDWAAQKLLDQANAERFGKQAQPAASAPAG